MDGIALGILPERRSARYCFLEIVSNEPLLFLLVGVEPNMSIRIGGMDGFRKRRRARGEEVLGGDKAGLGGVVR